MNFFLTTATTTIPASDLRYGDTLLTIDPHYISFAAILEVSEYDEEIYIKTTSLTIFDDDAVDVESPYLSKVNDSFDYNRQVTILAR